MYDQFIHYILCTTWFLLSLCCRSSFVGSQQWVTFSLAGIRLLEFIGAEYEVLTTYRKRAFFYYFAALLACLYCKAASADFERQFPLPKKGNDLVGENHSIRSTAVDTLVDISARYQLGYNLVRSVNPTVDSWLPGNGTKVLLPFKAILPAAERTGIVINVAEMRLYFYASSNPEETASVAIYPISVGRGGWETPVLNTRLAGRAKYPTWYPPPSIREEHAARGDLLPSAVPPGPANPLGKYLLLLDVPTYFIHGTNKSYGIGMQTTHGCIRMYSQDIEHLYKTALDNTPVNIINQRFKTGWLDGSLYLEVHPPLESDLGSVPENLTSYIYALVAATKDLPQTVIDWDRLDDIVSKASGVPELVGQLPTEQEISQASNR